MPNVRSQRIDATGLEIVASDGRQVLVTPAAVLTHYAAQSGSASARRTATLSALKAWIAAAVGADQVPITNITADIDASTGRVTRLELT